VHVHCTTSRAASLAEELAFIHRRLDRVWNDLGDDPTFDLIGRDLARAWNASHAALKAARGAAALEAAHVAYINNTGSR
jgi:hypothetical protein